MTKECPSRMVERTDSLRFVEETERELGAALAPEQIEAIHNALLRDWVIQSIGYAEVVYLVIGNYGLSTKPRLVQARDVLDHRSPNHLAFLLEDVDPESTAWQNFYVKFKVFASRSDLVVGVFEDNDGGHELEAGEVPHGKLYAFKREYEEQTDERAAYDGMLASLFEVLDNRGRLVRWSSPVELPALVDEHVPESV